MSKDQERADEFCKRLAMLTKGVKPLTTTQTKPTVLVPRPDLPEGFQERITPKRERKIQGATFQGKRRYHLNYKSPTSIREERSPTRLNQLASLMENEDNRAYNAQHGIPPPHPQFGYSKPHVAGGRTDRAAELQRANYLRRDDPSPRAQVEMERQGTSRGVEWMRQIRGIPAPQYKVDKTTGKRVKISPSYTS